MPGIVPFIPAILGAAGLVASNSQQKAAEKNNLNQQQGAVENARTSQADAMKQIQAIIASSPSPFSGQRIAGPSGGYGPQGGGGMQTAPSPFAAAIMGPQVPQGYPPALQAPSMPQGGPPPPQAPLLGAPQAPSMPPGAPAPQQNISPVARGFEGDPNMPLPLPHPLWHLPMQPPGIGERRRLNGGSFTDHIMQMRQM